MFFSLSKAPDARFPCQFQLGRLTLNTDQGWQKIIVDDRTIIYKGYIEQARLSDLAAEINDHEHMGNFCVFDYDPIDGCVRIKTNRYRSFNIWSSIDAVSNFQPTDQPIWADQSLVLDQDLEIHTQHFDAIGPIDAETIEKDLLVQLIHERLLSRVSQFLHHNHHPLKIFCGGGIDSMLVFSYIKTCTDRFQMVFMEHLEWDEFWCHNREHIKKNFWGYQQIHHWSTPTILSSGTPGDEFMLRSPTTANLWLMSKGTNIPEQLALHGIDGSMQGPYFNLEKNRTLFAEQQASPLEVVQEELIRYLCDILVNDQQHWHLGNTLTFTPLRDLEIAKWFFRLGMDHGLEQIMHSRISLELIAKNDPNLLDFLSEHKNSGEPLANLPRLMSRYSAVTMP